MVYAVIRFQWEMIRLHADKNTATNAIVVVLILFRVGLHMRCTHTKRHLCANMVLYANGDAVAKLNPLKLCLC